MSRALAHLLVPLAGFALAAAAHAQPPTLESLWPSDDGRSWIYDQHYESYGLVPEAVDNRTRLIFDGTAIAPDGIVTQYLRQQLLGGDPVPATAAHRVTDPLLRAVWMARPGLRSRIEASLIDEPCPEYHPPGAYAVLLDGEFAWRRTATEIAAWRCNLANTRAWKWLDADLGVGSTFRLQLVPDLAHDVFLDATVAAIEPVSVPAGMFEACVRVDYVIDYGTETCTDVGGNVIGTVKAETRGYVHYAPGVGPVDSHEQFFPAYEITGLCISVPPAGQPLTLVTMRLAELPAASTPTTWGKLKLVYR